MRSLQKIFWTIVAGLFVLAACSDENDPTPFDDQAPFLLNIFEESSFVTVPDGLIQSTDARAAIAAAYVTTANTFRLFQAFFIPPAGVEPGFQQITAPNGTSTLNADFTVYEWTDGAGTGIAYQYSLQNGRHVVEIFVSQNGGNYLKFVQAEQNDEATEGTMDFWDADGDDPTLISLKFSWSIDADGARLLSFQDTRSGSKVEVRTDLDLSGGVNVFQDGVLMNTFQWDVAGNGSWVDYNADGSIADQGSWTA